jgi:hypothetical protein
MGLGWGMIFSSRRHPRAEGQETRWMGFGGGHAGTLRDEISHRSFLPHTLTEHPHGQVSLELCWTQESQN